MFNSLIIIIILQYLCQGSRQGSSGTDSINVSNSNYKLCCCLLNRIYYIYTGVPPPDRCLHMTPETIAIQTQRIYRVVRYTELTEDNSLVSES